MPEESPNLKLRELLNRLAGSGQDTQDVEADSLAERSALANGDLVTLLDTESGRNVGGNVLVSLLVTRVLRDEVKVLAADDDGSVHLGGNDGASQDTATDRDETSEGALLVCKVKMSAMRSPCKSFPSYVFHHTPSFVRLPRAFVWRYSCSFSVLKIPMS
jgi:hypothetical protein